jgi:SEC-C motif-containing protein
MTDNDTCPCGSGNLYAACCGRFISGAQHAATAEQLMRSRYTAYARGDERYLLATWHATTKPEQLSLAQQPAPRWLGLKVVRTEAGGANDDSGVVDFIARYKIGGKAERLHEASRFIRQEGRWYYVDGETRPAVTR